MTSEVRTGRRGLGYALGVEQLTLHSRFGPLLRRFRTSRGVSQERLASDAEVSPRHVSFLETGRAGPSREMVLLLGSALDLPLRDRNSLLVAAGFAPVYAASPLGGPGLAPVRRALDHLLRAHEPFGAIVVDRDWNVLQLNDGARRLLAWSMEGLTPPPEALGNLLRGIFHPQGLRSRIVNFDEVAALMIDRAERELELEADDDRRTRVSGWVTAARAEVPPLAATPRTTDPFLSVHLRKNGEDLRLFTTLTTLGTPIDVTAQELRIESYFPADAASEALLLALARNERG